MVSRACHRSGWRSYSGPKIEWREGNARYVKGVRNCQGQTLLDKVSGKLRCRILDLAGEDPQEVLSAYNSLLDSPRHLVLFEHDVDVYYRALRNLEIMCPSGRPHLVKNDAYSVGSAINNGTCKGDDPDAPPFGVLSLDLVNYACQNWWVEQGRQFFECLINPAIKRFGVCVVILNHTLDGRMGHEDTLVRLEEHVDCLRKRLHEHTGRGLARSEFLPSRDAVRELIFNGTCGPLGAVHVYRSRRMRMATIRMYLQKGKCRIQKETV